MLVGCGRACKLLQTTKRKHSCKLSNDTSLQDKLNHFYARFEASNTEACNWQVSSLTFFNLSLTESVITTRFKQTTIVPVPKNTKSILTK